MGGSAVRRNRRLLVAVGRVRRLWVAGVGSAQLVDRVSCTGLLGGKWVLGGWQVGVVDVLFCLVGRVVIIGVVRLSARLLLCPPDPVCPFVRYCLFVACLSFAVCCSLFVRCSFVVCPWLFAPAFLENRNINFPGRHPAPNLCFGTWGWGGISVATFGLRCVSLRTFVATFGLRSNFT